MLQSIGSGIKTSVIKAKNKTLNRLGKIKRFISRYRKCIFITLLTLGIVAMITAMVMEAIDGNDLSQQGIIINHTEERIKNITVSNDKTLIGLNSQLYNLPKRKFILYFGDTEDIDSPYVYTAINGRVSQGTKITIDARVSCQVVSSDLYLFLEQYGLDWKIYALEKAKNVIIQVIAGIKFYDLSNEKIIEEANSIFNSYISSSYPFRMELMGIKIKYPEGSFSENNTIGINLLEKTSLQTQLEANYDQVDRKIKNNLGQLTDIASQIGKLEGEINRKKLQMGSMRNRWISGVEKMGSMGNQEEVRRFLWVYFQNMYNSSYVENRKSQLL